LKSHFLPAAISSLSPPAPKHEKSKTSVSEQSFLQHHIFCELSVSSYGLQVPGTIKEVLMSLN
jgi:hypothetical protein